jgi:hypothetical protein
MIEDVTEEGISRGNESGPPHPTVTWGVCFCWNPMSLFGAWAWLVVLGNYLLWVLAIDRAR